LLNCSINIHKNAFILESSVAHLVKRLIELLTGQMSLGRRDVAEANVDALRLDKQIPAVARPDKIGEVARKREHAVDVGLEAARALRFPHVPELDDVGAAAALHVPIAKVERRVVELVILEEIARSAAVRRL